MTLATFFEKFDQFADAPDAVAKMRRFILDLAVQGRLVAQDASDESADELLKRVRAEKARLVKSGEIKKQEPLPPISEEAIPFSLPAGWTPVLSFSQSSAAGCSSVNFAATQTMVFAPNPAE